jgi:FkbM family methyltransferase
VNPGDTILDVGAWIGPTTFLFSHLIGKNGRVYAFEPNPESFSILKKYVIDNNLDTYNIYLHNMALSNLVGFVKLYAPSQIDQKSTIQRDRAGAFKYEWKCDCTTIDEFCLSRDIRPNGIKIDVEGAEMNVLEGAIEIIEKYHPWFILEFHGLFLSEYERRRIWSFITDRAKKIIYILGDENYLAYKMDEPLNFKPAERSNYCIFF